MAETVSITIPQSGEITTAAQAALAKAREFTVDSEENYKFADVMRVGAGEMVKQGEALFKDATAEANRVHKRLVGLLKAATEPWSNVAAIYRHKMIAWDEEQKRIQARRQAEEDAKAKKQAEEEQRELAETMRELGLEQQAAELDRGAPIYNAPIVPRETEPAIKYRTNWTFEIECLTCGTWFKYSLLNLHQEHNIQTSGIDREFMVPDWSKIGRLVRAFKGETNIGGIRPLEEKV